MGNIFNRNLRNIKMSQIKRNPNQPRKYFDPVALEELKESIIKCGLINPISVKKVDNYYQIVAGERRFRASNLAGLTEIPCLILSNNDEKCALISLVENIQRYNLNFIEEAIAYKKFINDFGVKQEELAVQVGKTQSSVANKLRILKLDVEVLKEIKENSLTERHARALLKLPEEKRLAAVQYIAKNGLNVAKSEQYIEELLIYKKKPIKNFIKVSKDVRLFINSINKSVKLMQEAGIKAEMDKQQTEEYITYNIIIPVKR